jgi:hypothetical protein
MATELEENCLPYEKCPHFWEWFDRIYRLKDKLDLREI